MKNEIKLQKAYEQQKQSFDVAKAKRISNREKEITAIERKILILQQQVARLRTENQSEREFESFDSFRLRAESQSKQSSTA